MSLRSVPEANGGARGGAAAAATPLVPARLHPEAPPTTIQADDGSAGGLFWETTRAADLSTNGLAAAFGPHLGRAASAPTIVLKGPRGAARVVRPPRRRWLLVVPGGLSQLSGSPDTRETALEAAVASAEPCVLVDFVLRDVVVVNGREAQQPLFMRTDPNGSARVLEGVAALRSDGGIEPLPAAVSFLLGFGHVPGNGRTLRHVWAVQPGEILRIPLSEAGDLREPGGPQWLPPPSDLLGAGGDATRLFLDRVLTPEVAGRKVAIACARGSPAALRLVEACREVGAAEVVEAPLALLPASLSQVQSVAIALSGVPHADAGLLLDAALALGATETADIVLLPWGGEILLPSRPEMARVEAKLSRREREDEVPRSIAEGFLSGGQFVRDAVFEEIAVFTDDEIYRVMGPRLFAEGFRSLGDELGDHLEGLAPGDAARTAARLDPSLAPGGSASALLGALRVMSTGRLIAPFLSAVTPHLPQETVKRPAAAAILRAADIVPGRLGSVLGEKAAVFSLGIVSRNTRIMALLKQGSSGSPRQRAQALVLLALEKWLRVVGAEAVGTADAHAGG